MRPDFRHALRRLRPRSRRSRGPWLAIVPLLLGTALAPAADRAVDRATDRATEVHQRLDIRPADHARDIALTLDACSGAVDQTLLDTLVRLRVPATLFVTQRWLQRHADTAKWLQGHGELFQIENHGAHHVPAVVGRTLYGMAGPATLDGVTQEIRGGADAITQALGVTPRWYRGAGARYDAASLKTIEQLGLRVAGFSVNVDDGASLPASRVAARLRRVQPGDILLAHMNHPAAGTGAGLAQALPELQRQGLRFVRLSDAAGIVAQP
jgi:peptidoglycan/xylan/chitin deacetylase (PgdA/CDA1 family)